MQPYTTKSGVASSFSHTFGTVMVRASPLSQPTPANEIRAGIRERLFCDRRQLCAANGIPPSPDRPTTSSTTFVIRFISLIRFSLSAVRESEGENHASEATLCLASQTDWAGTSFRKASFGPSQKSGNAIS